MCQKKFSLAIKNESMFNITIGNNEYAKKEKDRLKQVALIDAR